MFVHPVHLIKVCVSYFAAITGYMNDHKVYIWFLRGETEKEEIFKSVVEAYLSAQHAFSAPPPHPHPPPPKRFMHRHACEKKKQSA